ncbi:ParA family protein [Infirmifilum sp. SLHALR2]|nr:MAG: hypothetical protein B7L53_05650 [Thermofilum sp. NZ13]
MVIVAFASGNKGGTGKTVTASLLSYHLAKSGRQVLLIDLGEYGSSTRLTLDRDPGPPYLNDYFLGNASWSDVIVTSPFSDNLHVAPSRGEIGPVDAETLEYLLDRVSSRVSHVFIDLPAYPGSLYDPIVGLAEIIVPVFNPDSLSFQAVKEWLKRRAFRSRKLVLPLLNKYFTMMGEWKEKAEDEFGSVFTLPFDSALLFSLTSNIEDAYSLSNRRVKDELRLLAYRIEKPLLKVTG